MLTHWSLCMQKPEISNGTYLVKDISAFKLITNNVIRQHENLMSY